MSDTEWIAKALRAQAERDLTSENMPLITQFLGVDIRIVVRLMLICGISGTYRTEDENLRQIDLINQRLQS